MIAQPNTGMQQIKVLSFIYVSLAEQTCFRGFRSDETQTASSTTGNSLSEPRSEARHYVGVLILGKILLPDIYLRLVINTWLIRLPSYVSVRIVCFRMKSHGNTRVNIMACCSCFNY